MHYKQTDTENAHEELKNVLQEEIKKIQVHCILFKMQICSSHFYGTIFIYLTKICWIFFFKQKTAYEMQRGLVGSEMCIRVRLKDVLQEEIKKIQVHCILYKMQICSSHFYGTIFIYLTKICWIFFTITEPEREQKSKCRNKDCFQGRL